MNRVDQILMLQQAIVAAGVEDVVMEEFTQGDEIDPSYIMETVMPAISDDDMYDYFIEKIVREQKVLNAITVDGDLYELEGIIGSDCLAEIESIIELGSVIGVRVSEEDIRSVVGGVVPKWAAYPAPKESDDTKKDLYFVSFMEKVVSFDRRTVSVMASSKDNALIAASRGEEVEDFGSEPDRDGYQDTLEQYFDSSATVEKEE